jgi:glycosyltransferase involved in cell wall biosynthesis
MKVAVVSTHPIQYYSPWFQRLAKKPGLELKVYYALLPDQHQQGVGFGQSFAWDIPLLEGFDWELMPNKRQSPSLKGFLRSSTPAIHSLLADSRPDAVIITGWQSLPLIQALIACTRLRIPRVVRGESNALRERPWSVRRLHHSLLSRFNAFLAIGKLNRDFYLQNGVPEERIFSTPYFVDNERFRNQYQQDVSDRAVLREKWGIPENSTCFLFAGKLEPKKRIMDLLYALKDARLTDPTTERHLLIAGTGEEFDKARAFCEANQLPVTFAGFMNQTEITRAYVASDCLVLPSDFGETWGLVVNEAMACGRPVIVSNRVGCAPDLVKDGITGAVFQFGDTRALGEKLIEFCNRGKRVRMGSDAFALVQDYSVERAVEGTVKALEFTLRIRSSAVSTVVQPHAN